MILSFKQSCLLGKLSESQNHQFWLSLGMKKLVELMITDDVKQRKQNISINSAQLHNNS